MRVNEALQFQLFMELADGGELYDQIEPDVGLPPARARNFFAQLLDGLLFIHDRGCKHFGAIFVLIAAFRRLPSRHKSEFASSCEQFRVLKT